MRRADETPTRTTIEWLRFLRRRRAAIRTAVAEGWARELDDEQRRVHLTTDPAWLVNMAINRRASWPDDPSTSRGSARPNHRGGYPRKASGDYYRHLRLIAREINTPGLIVRPERLGEHRWLLQRIPERFTYRETA